MTDPIGKSRGAGVEQFVRRVRSISDPSEVVNPEAPLKRGLTAHAIVWVACCGRFSGKIAAHESNQTNRRAGGVRHAEPWNAGGVAGNLQV